MKRILIKMSALTLALGAMMPFVASCSCGKQTPSDKIDSNYEWVVDETITDSSQLASYPGQNKMELLAWNINQMGGYKQYNSSNDIVSAEIERVTGVKIDKWMDNGGKAAELAYTEILSMRDKPHIAFGGGWIDTNEVWDLTELIDEYCPTIKARMPKSVWNSTQVTGGKAGKVYGIPYGLGNMGLSDLDPEATAENAPLFQFLNEPYPYIMVREDVLTEAYPDAKTTEEIEAIYKQNGGFTEEELFDVEITSAEQFRTEFLPNIQKVLDTNPRYTSSNGRKVKAMMVTDGSDYDTWSFLGVLIPKLLGGAGTHMNTQFSYWDKSTQKVELMLTQDWYLDEVEEWANLVAQGKYVTKNEFDSNHAMLQEALNSGYYAIGYQSNCLPSGNKATYLTNKGTTETVNYRKVYMKIPIRENMEFFASGTPAVNSVMFFKDTVRESDLPQLLRWLDYQCSRLADKVYAWGPSSAGLFTEDENGVRKFKNDELTNQMVYSTASVGDLVQKYNLANGTRETVQPTFPFAYAGASIYHPKNPKYSDLSKMEGMASTFFSSAIVCSDIKPIGIAKPASIHYWTESDLKGVTEKWGKRKMIEDDLKKILNAGGSSSKFNSAVNNLKSTLNSIGWTKAYFNGAYTNKFLALNADYLDAFYRGE